MAYTTGTATDYKNLLSLLVSFATANGWTALEQTTDIVVLHSNGLSGLENIYCGIQTYENPASSIYLWKLYGMVAYKPSRAGFITKQPGASLAASSYWYSGYTSSNYDIWTPFWNTSIPYWFFVNAQRIIVVAKVSTTYQFVYLGFINRFGTSNQYPYPFFVGGSGSGSTYYSYSYASLQAFWNYYGSSGKIYSPSGSWFIKSSGTLQNEPGTVGVSSLSNEPYGQFSSVLPSPDGTYWLSPTILFDFSFKFYYGELDGLFRVSGYQNTPENILSIGGVNYLVFQNVNKNGYGDFCAIPMV